MNDSTFSQGQLFGERYRIVQKIGEGGMQRVFKAVDTLLDKHVALKVPKNLSAQKRFQRSAIVSAKINHPNVAKTLDYIESDSDPCLIEELIEGKDLQLAVLKPLGQLDPYLAARIFHYLAKGISASHHAGVIHRDLKPSNVMVAGGINLDVIKITDFGIAKMAEEELAQATQEGQSSMSNSQTALGALPYMSPEMLDPMQTVGREADIWSLGAMMYELLSGQKPFGGNWKAVHEIFSGHIPPIPDFIEETQFRILGTQLYELIVSCLNLEPEKRPTADDLVSSCQQLCYPVNERKIGIVTRLSRANQGFISDLEEGKSFFFHFQSVYGKTPTVGDKVCFSSFPATPAYRAHPVVVMNNDEE